MPKLVKEITSGGSNERSADGGAVADVSVRTFRIILNSPSEGYDIQSAIGVKIGDMHPVNSTLPCVSFSERAEGESRVVRVVTATYRATPGSSTANDPNNQPPDIRPAKFSISSSLVETPATQWAEIEDEDGNPVQPQFAPAVNPVKDRYDGVTNFSSMLTISIEQFDNYPTSRLTESGFINSDRLTFLGMDVAPYTCMLRGVNVRPTVEAFGTLIYRGFTRTYEFAINPYDGWWKRVVIEGFNIINKNLNGANVYNEGLNLQHVDGEVVVPFALTENTANKKVRAVIPIASLNGKRFMQRPSALPVALNLDGTPRDVQANGVLTKKYITQGAIPFGNNFVNMGVRIQDIV
jgi:hypothetical protein